jgi:serine protease Do
MHKRLPRLMALWLAATLAAPLSSAQDTMSAEQLYQYLAPSVWLVRSLDADGLLVSTGSAVVTGVETLLTNCHVLKGAKRLVVRNDNVLHEARLRHIDVERDLCEISARNLRAPAVALGDSDQLTVGQKVYALGNPRGLELTLSDGIVSALRRDEDLRHLHFIQTTAPISPGSSGGGLFDNQGRLIGITTLQFR